MRKMNFPLKRRDLEEFIGTKPVVEYTVQHEKYIGIGQIIIEAGEEIPAFRVDYEWVVKICKLPRVAGATEAVKAGSVEQRSVHFALPRVINNRNDILLMRCMGGMVVSLTNRADELTDAMSLKEK